MSKKTCFVISPIGEEGTEERKRINNMYEYIIKEAVESENYTTSRADLIDKSGIITYQIIEKLIDSDLVIADLTNHNPNVFYELAIRHSTGKPFIQIIDYQQEIPFDISTNRTIIVNFSDIESVAKCKASIIGQLKSFVDGETVDSPVSDSINLMLIKQKGSGEKISSSELISIMREMISRIDVNGLRSTITKEFDKLKIELYDNLMVERGVKFESRFIHRTEVIIDTALKIKEVLANITMEEIDRVSLINMLDRLVYEIHRLRDRNLYVHHRRVDASSIKTVD